MKNLNIFSLVAEYDNAKSGGILNKPNVSFVNEDNSVKYLIDPYNGYEYVDLGLPSGLKWATCNIGATSPEQSGLFFQSAEIKGYTYDYIENLPGNGSEKYENFYKNTDGKIYLDAIEKSLENMFENTINFDIDIKHDAAHAYMGGNWRVPTIKEFDELFNTYDDNGLKYINCEYIENYNNTNVNGFLITSKINGNTMFLPTFVDNYEICYNSSTIEFDIKYSYSNSLNYQNVMGSLGWSFVDPYYFNNIRAVCK